MDVGPNCYGNIQYIFEPYDRNSVASYPRSYLIPSPPLFLCALCLWVGGYFDLYLQIGSPG